MLNVWCSCCDGALCDVKTPSILLDLTTIIIPSIEEQTFAPAKRPTLVFPSTAPLKSHSPGTQVLNHTPQLRCDRLKFLLLEYKEWDKRSYFRVCCFLLPCLFLHPCLLLRSERRQVLLRQTTRNFRWKTTKLTRMNLLAVPAKLLKALRSAVKCRHRALNEGKVWQPLCRSVMRPPAPHW
jgi:hypothetical protein